jgi:superfamily II DNA/RNA helicase
LLATNVAARGLDVLSIEQVINYELPESAELFTHRVGRTGRMDNTGEAITLLTPDDMAAWRRFQRDLALKMKPLPFPMGDIPVNTHAPAPTEASTQASETSAVTPALTPVVATEQAEPERRGGWIERRPERPTQRFNERRGERRPDGRPQRGAEGRGFAGGRGYERGPSSSYATDEGERRPARRQFGDDSRPARREDAATRWSRPAPESSRDGYRTDYREGRYERGEDDHREDRFSPERPERAERAPRRDERRSDERPAGRANGPRRAASGFRPAEGGAPRRSAGGRAGQPAGRPGRAGRAGGSRPSRG